MATRRRPTLPRARCSAVWFVLVGVAVSALPGGSGAESAVGGARFLDLLEKYLVVRTRFAAAPPAERQLLLEGDAREVLGGLAAIQSEESLRFFEEEFASAPAELGAMAAAVLLESRDDAPQRLRGLLAHHDATVRRAVLAGFARSVLDPRLIDSIVVDLLRTEDDVALLEPLLALAGRIDTAAAAEAGVAAFERALGTPREAGVEAALRAALGRAGGPEARAWLAGPALESRSPRLLRVLVATAGRLELAEASPTLIELLRDGDEQLAAVTLGALGRLGLLEEAVTIVRHRYGPQKLLPLLVASEERSALAVVADAVRRGNRQTRAAALESLARGDGGGAALPTLLGLLEEAPRTLLPDILDAVGVYRHRAMIAPLIDVLGARPNGADGAAKRRALEILVRLSGREADGDAAAWAAWWAAAAPSFELPAPQAGGRRTVAVPAGLAPQTLQFFGAEVIDGSRITFVVDVSTSMQAIVPARRVLPSAVAPPRSGRTRAVVRAGGAARRAAAPATATKLELLKDELVWLLEGLTADTQVNIIAFSGRFHSWRSEPETLRGTTRQEAIQFARDLAIGAGGTNIYDALESALADPLVEAVFLLSDGQPNKGRFTDPARIIAEVRKRNRRRRVEIHGVAFGAESALLADLARENLGVYRFVDLIRSR